MNANGFVIVFFNRGVPDIAQRGCSPPRTLSRPPVSLMSERVTPDDGTVNPRTAL